MTENIKLHGRMDLQVAFDGKVLVTPIYIKMDAHDQLLLSEGVCSQLGELVSDSPAESDKQSVGKTTVPVVRTYRVSFRAGYHTC